MKFGIFAFVALHSAAPAHATELTSHFGFGNAGGFRDDGFTSPESVCYTGDVRDVCGLVADGSGGDAAKSMRITPCDGMGNIDPRN